MKTTLKLIACLIPAIALTGCAEMLQASQEARATLDKIMGYGGKTERHTSGESAQSAPVTNDTPSKICKAYQESAYQAEDFYKGKTLTAKGKVYSISLYGISFTNNRVLISKMSREKVKVGQSYSTTGKIYQIDFGGTNFDCKITLM